LSFYTGRAKKPRLFLGVDNFVTVVIKVSDISKVSKFCLENVKTYMLVKLNIFLRGLHKIFNALKIMPNLTITHEFYSFLTQTKSENNSNGN